MVVMTKVLFIFGLCILTVGVSKASPKILQYKVVSEDKNTLSSNPWVGFRLMVKTQKFPTESQLRQLVDSFTSSRKGMGVKLKIWAYLPGMHPGDEEAFAVAQYSASGEMIDFHVIELSTDQKKRVTLTMRKQK